MEPLNTYPSLERPLTSQPNVDGLVYCLGFWALRSLELVTVVADSQK